MLEFHFSSLKVIGYSTPNHHLHEGRGLNLYITEPPEASACLYEKRFKLFAYFIILELP